MSVQALTPAVPTQMIPVDLQRSNEFRFARVHINKYITAELTNSAEIMAKVDEGVQLLEDWCGQTYYASKEARLDQIRGLDLHDIVLKVFVATAFIRETELFTAVTAQLAGILHFDDKIDAIKTVAEITAVLCRTNVFDIIKPSKYASLMIVSRIQLTPQLLQYIEESKFLPPMVCTPEPIKHNRQSGYLTYDDNVILKAYNRHDGDLCLDVINLQNSVPMQLNVEFLRTVEEVPGKDLEALDPNLSEFEARQVVKERIKQWDQFVRDSRQMYALMAGQGNLFYFTHKVDKRGRMYAQGYQINPQGSSYKKAMLELAYEEVVNGVPV